MLAGLQCRWGSAGTAVTHEACCWAIIPSSSAGPPTGGSRAPPASLAPLARSDPSSPQAWGCARRTASLFVNCCRSHLPAAASSERVCGRQQQVGRMCCVLVQAYERLSRIAGALCALFRPRCRACRVPRVGWPHPHHLPTAPPLSSAGTLPGRTAVAVRRQAAGWCAQASSQRGQQQERRRSPPTPPSRAVPAAAAGSSS